MSERQRSATVRGAGELSGGDYHRISIFGAGEVDGDVRAGRLRVFGAGELHGNAQIDWAAILGVGEFDRDLTGKRLRTFGSLSVGGAADVKQFRVMGACIVEGRILADELRVFGALECGGAETGTFLVRGTIDIDGLLAGDTVEIHLSGNRSRVGAIGGERVEVWRRTFGEHNALLRALAWLSSFAGRRGRLDAGEIEADDICLENTRAKVVRGRRVTIGIGCQIESVEYAETLSVHRAARVERRQRI
jgi:cytoskeletal protein CcmA (bactofilin family)